MSNLMTQPEAMRDYSRRFAAHADVIEDEARRATAASQNISGVGWTGAAEGASNTSVTEMQRAFYKIRDMMQFTSENLARSADTYEAQEQEGTQALSS